MAIDYSSALVSWLAVGGAPGDLIGPILSMGLMVGSFHCAYSSAKARTDVPEFRACIGLEAGARQTFADMRARGAWRDGGQDLAYQRIVERALTLGFEVEEA